MSFDYCLGSTETIQRVVARCDALACLSRHVQGDTGAVNRCLVVLRTRLPATSRHQGKEQHRELHLDDVTFAFLRHCGAAKAAVL